MYNAIEYIIYELHCLGSRIPAMENSCLIYKYNRSTPLLELPGLHFTDKACMGPYIYINTVEVLISRFFLENIIINAQWWTHKGAGWWGWSVEARSTYVKCWQGPKWRYTAYGLAIMWVFSAFSGNFDIVTSTYLYITDLFKKHQPMIRLLHKY